MCHELSPDSPLSVQGKIIDLGRSARLHHFTSFDLTEWQVVGNPKWKTNRDSLTGGGPDETEHGQVFYKTPYPGDIVLSFEAETVSPCNHDIICWLKTALDQDPWGDGYLAGFGGWFRDRAGIERVPAFDLVATAAGFSTVPGERYHVVFGCIGNHLFLAVNGVVAIELFDSSPLPDNHVGHFGFGIYESWVKYSNLMVLKPCWDYVEENY